MCGMTSPACGYLLCQMGHPLPHPFNFLRTIVPTGLVGLAQGIQKDDCVITAYRCHPFAVLHGRTTGVIGELLGHRVGMSHGKGSSMHIFTPSFFGGNGTVGAQVPIGAGIYCAIFALYGDGACSQDQGFEAFNLPLEANK